jgi:hypothetical protein
MGANFHTIRTITFDPDISSTLWPLPSLTTVNEAQAFGVPANPVVLFRKSEPDGLGLLG